MQHITRSGTAALRRGRASVIGQIYSLTTVTAGRRACFGDFLASRQAVRALRDLQHEAVATTLAFVIMPDHVHWLMQLGEGTVANAVQRFKGRVARRAGQVAGARGTFWQRGYFDHALRADEDVVRVARYIVMNPVRAGLVSSIGQYPHWDCAWL